MRRLQHLLLLSLSVLLIGCRAPIAQIEPQLASIKPTSPNWEKEITAFEASDRTNSPPRNALLFIGSSSIRMWKSLATDFPRQQVINRGFGGSQIIDSVYYADRIVFPYRPRKIVIYAGGNDINAGKTPEQVFADYQLFVETVRRKLPRTDIAYISIAPNPARWAQIERVRAANHLIREYAARKARLSFIDVHARMLNEKGEPREGIFLPDRLHMNEKGYQIWKQIIGPAL